MKPARLLKMRLRGIMWRNYAQQHTTSMNSLPSNSCERQHPLSSCQRETQSYISVVRMRVLPRRYHDLHNVSHNVKAGNFSQRWSVIIDIPDSREVVHPSRNIHRPWNPFLKLANKLLCSSNNYGFVFMKRVSAKSLVPRFTKLQMLVSIHFPEHGSHRPGDIDCQIGWVGFSRHASTTYIDLSATPNYREYPVHHPYCSMIARSDLRTKVSWEQGKCHTSHSPTRTTSPYCWCSFWKCLCRPPWL